MATPSAYAHYKCNDNLATTVVIDTGTGANNGTASANTSALSSTGKINESFLFDDTIVINSDGIAGRTDLSGSISFWITQGSVSYETYFSWGDTDADAVWTCRRFGASGAIEFGAGGSQNAYKWRVRGGDISTGFHHAVITVNGSVKPLIYVDGETVETTEAWGTPNYAGLIETALDNFRFATYNMNSVGDDYTYYPDGAKIDDWRYYPGVVLTQEDVNNIYRGGVGTEDDPPSLWLPGFPHSQGFIIS